MIKNYELKVNNLLLIFIVLTFGVL